MYRSRYIQPKFKKSILYNPIQHFALFGAQGFTLGSPSTQSPNGKQMYANSLHVVKCGPVDASRRPSLTLFDRRE